MTPAEARDVGAVIFEDRLDDRGIGPGERRFEVDDRRLRGDRADHLDVEVHLARAGAQRDLPSDEAPFDHAADGAGLAVPGLDVGVEERVERHDRHGLALASEPEIVESIDAIRPPHLRGQETTLARFADLGDLPDDSRRCAGVGTGRDDEQDGHRDRGDHRDQRRTPRRHGSASVQ